MKPLVCVQDSMGQYMMPSSWLGRSWRRLGLGLAPVAIHHWPLDRRILLGAGSGAGAGTGTGAGAAAGAGALLVDCWVASREERSLLDVDVLLLDLLLLDLLTEGQLAALNLGMAGRQASKHQQKLLPNFASPQNKLFTICVTNLSKIPPYHCKSLKTHI